MTLFLIACSQLGIDGSAATRDQCDVQTRPPRHFVDALFAACPAWLRNVGYPLTAPSVDILHSQRYYQIIGRAGRAGMAEAGEGILFAPARKKELATKAILSQPVQPVRSQLQKDGGKHLRSAILNAVVASKDFTLPMAELQEWLKSA